MAMPMDEQPSEEDSFSVQLQVGEEITLIPWDDEPFVVTHVFLVDPESAAASQPVVAAACIKNTGVKMGTQNIMLAQLSSEMTEVELEAPVVLDEECCFYAMRPGGEIDTNTNTDKDAVIVQFKGFVLYPDTESEEGDEEAASSEDDNDDGSDEDSEEEDKESGGEINIDMAKEVGGLQLEQS